MLLYVVGLRTRLCLSVFLCLDIAVGAPFAKQEDGAEGIVYIYLGSGKTVINKEHADVRSRQSLLSCTP